MSKFIFLLFFLLGTLTINAQRNPENTFEPEDIELMMAKENKGKKKEKKVKKSKKSKKDDLTESKDSLKININDFPLLFVESDTVDFGQVTRGCIVDKKLVIHNKGKAPLTISDCEGSCYCTVPICPKEIIHTNQIAELAIQYDTNILGVINKSISFKTNDPQNPIKTIYVVGEIILPE